MPPQPTVLVVEDLLGPRESLRAILQPDYHVLMTEEGEHALHLVEHEPVDVVLLDLRLPGLSGLQVMEKLKALSPSLAVIVVTSYASEETEREVLRLRTRTHAASEWPPPRGAPLAFDNSGPLVFKGLSR